MTASPATRARWTPGTFLAVLIVLELLALQFSPLRWFAAFNHRAWTPLFAVELALGGLIVLAFWAIVARLRQGKFQFSLRALVLLFVALAVPLAALAAEIRWAAGRRDRAAALARLHARAHSGGTLRNPSPLDYYYEPEWLAAWLGSDLFRPPETSFTANRVSDESARRFRDYPETEYVAFLQPQLTDDGWRQLRHWPHLNRLAVRDAVLTDAAVDAIAAQRALQQLILEDVRMTDEQLGRLGRLPELRNLFLSNVPVTGEGFAAWSASNPLTNLRLRRTQPTAVGLQALAGFSQLETLDVASSPVTDATLEGWKPPRNLVHLNLSRTSITDTSLGGLNGLHSLTRLNLSGTAITDEGVFALTRLPQLLRVDLSSTSVSRAAMRRLVDHDAGPWTVVSDQFGTLERGVPDRAPPP